MQPAISPRTYTQTLFQWQWKTMAGPRARAGLTAPPENAAAAGVKECFHTSNTEWSRGVRRQVRAADSAAGAQSAVARWQKVALGLFRNSKRRRQHMTHLRRGWL